MGRVRGHRCRHGELTVKVARGEAQVWVSVRRVWIEPADGAAGRFYEVEASRAYRDRLVLKLRGLDDPTRVAELRGCSVKVPQSGAPPLEPGEYHVTRLVGLGVYDESGSRLGTVRDILPTGGVDVLIVERSADGAGSSADGKKEADEFMVPMAQTIVLEISPERGRIVLRPPEGLLDLNRERGKGTS